MNKKINLSVGIPAYNEEANIGNLLKSILSQRNDSFILLEIIVISDCSNDNTMKIVKKFSDKKIRKFENDKRIGQAATQNKIIDLFKGDILVILESDTIPAGKYFLQNLIKPLVNDKSKNIGIAYGFGIPLKPNNFFEKIMYFKTELKNNLLMENNEYFNHDASGLNGRAFSRKFIEKMTWNLNLPEDSYVYLMAEKFNFKSVFVSQAKIFHRLPSNFNDYFNQYNKFISGKRALACFFNNNEINKLSNYNIPISFRNILILLIFLFKNPILMISYISVLTLVYFRSLNNTKFHPFLKSYLSTKNLK